MSADKSQSPSGEKKEDFGKFARKWYETFSASIKNMAGNGKNITDAIDLTGGDEPPKERKCPAAEIDLTLSDSDERDNPTTTKTTNLSSNQKAPSVSSKPSQSGSPSQLHHAHPSPAVKRSTSIGHRYALPTGPQSSPNASSSSTRKASSHLEKAASNFAESPAIAPKQNRSAAEHLFPHPSRPDQNVEGIKSGTSSDPASGPKIGSDITSKSSVPRKDGAMAAGMSTVKSRPHIASGREHVGQSAAGRPSDRPKPKGVMREYQKAEPRKSSPKQPRTSMPRLPSRPLSVGSKPPQAGQAKQTEVNAGTATKSRKSMVAPLAEHNRMSSSSKQKQPEAPADVQKTQTKASNFIDLTEQDESDTPKEVGSISKKFASNSFDKKQIEDSEDDNATARRNSPARASNDGLQAVEPNEDNELLLQDNFESLSHLAPKGYTDSISSNSPLVSRMRAKRASFTSSTAENKGKNVSPRREMSRKATADARISTKVEIKVPDLVESLARLEQSAVDDHARNVRISLLDAKDVSKKFAKPNYVDEISPFASMTALQIPANHNTNKEAKFIKLDTRHYRNKNMSRNKCVVPTTSISTDVSRVPTYRDITNVKRTFLTCDKKNPDFFPLIGDTDPKKDEKMHEFRREWERTYHGRVILRTAASLLEAEKSMWLRPYFIHWMIGLNVGLDEMRFIHHTLKKQEVKPLRLKPFESVYKDQIVLDLSAQKKMFEHAETIAKAFDKATELDLLDVLLPQALVNEMVKSINDIKDKADEALSPNRGLETYARLTCMICQVLNCPTHGEYNCYRITCGESEVGSTDDHSVSDEIILDEEEYLHDGIVLTYNDLLRRHETRTSSKKTNASLSNGQSLSTPCSADCYSVSDLIEQQPDWSEEDIGFLESLLITNDANDKRLSCDLAVALDRPCWQVNGQMKSAQSLKQPPDSSSAAPQSRGKALDWYQPAKKTINKKEFEHTTSVFHENRAQWKPCAHDGPCVATCPCVKANLPCEILCGCPDDCIRKFTGCACASRGQNCVSHACICIRLNRECGPQCSPCGALPRLDPKNRFNDDLFTKGCQNVAIQRNVHKKVLLGKSSIEVAGYGLYLAEPAQKGQFIGDYTGEVITGEEAERRGCLYDHVSKSFLFTLNREMIIDAARLGNKTRFINHARDAQHGLNCGASVRFVNGEHRIKFTAERDIAAGEELFFDYGKAFADKHGLNGTIPKKKGVASSAGGSKKRGIEEVYAEEEEEEEERAPRGYVGRKKEMREKTQAMLGLEGPARKARKLAPGLRKAIRGVERERSVSKEVESQDVVGGEEEVEGEELGEAESDESEFAPGEERGSEEGSEDEEDEEVGVTPKKRVKRRPVRFRDEEL